MSRFRGGAVLIAFFVIRNLAVECQDRRIIIHVPHSVRTVHHHHHHVVLMDPKTRTATRDGPRSSSEEDFHAQLQTDVAVVYPVARQLVFDAFSGRPVRNKRSKLVAAGRRYVLVKSSDYY